MRVCVPLGFALCGADAVQTVMATKEAASLLMHALATHPLDIDVQRAGVSCLRNLAASNGNLSHLCCRHV